VDPHTHAAARPHKRRKRARRKTKPRCQAPRKRKARGSQVDSPFAVDAKRRRRKVKRHACSKRRKKAHRKVHRTAPVQPVPPAPNPAPSTSSNSSVDSPLPTYSGPFGRAQAERLLWRAGFGPSPGHADFLAGMGLEQAVASLTRPQGSETLTGAEPTDDDGNPIAPADAWGHDHLWFLDRMVRTNQPLVERMTLIWHDWFATSIDGVGNQQYMLDQNALFRRYWMGPFDQLVHDVTCDPAMLVWLNGIDNHRNQSNENYARELMELFTLGADRGAYTEDDVRELARSLTGWRADWSAELGDHNFRFYLPWFDSSNKTVFGQTGNWTWEHAGAMCVHHALHPSFFVTKLWSYFIPVPPSEAERVALEQLYVQSGYQVRPVVEAILLHPQLHTGPRMVKPPVVYLAGMLRALRRAVDTDAWAWMCQNAGQRLFAPPDVSGWDDSRWLDTSTIRGRWQLVGTAVIGRTLSNAEINAYDATETPEQGVERAREYWGWPALTAETAGVLANFAAACVAGATASWQQHQYRGVRQNAMRHLLFFSPDLQTS
jgi:Protein of unknown function (DUF1800)